MKTTKLKAANYEEAIKLISEIEVYNDGDKAIVTLDSGLKVAYIFKENWEEERW